MFISDQSMHNNRVINQACFIWACNYSAVSASSCQVYPSEYAYHEDSVYRTERSSANCRNYQSGFDSTAQSENYIHCNGTPLRLTDSDIGSEQYTTSDYYVWPAGSRHSQLLFIFSTTISLKTVTLPYYHTFVIGLPRLRFWAVPDDFDAWDALSSSYSYVEVPPGGNSSAGLGNISINIEVFTKKVLLFKFSSSSAFVLSEVEFFTRACTSKS